MHLCARLLVFIIRNPLTLILPRSCTLNDTLLLLLQNTVQTSNRVFRTGMYNTYTYKRKGKLPIEKQVDVLPSKSQALCCKLNLLIYNHSMYCNDVT